MAIQRFNSSVRFKDGKYEVSMPWKSDVTALPNNFDMALNLSLSIEKRRLKDLLLSGVYSNIIADYLREGYISKELPPETRSPGTSSISHS